jgi:hypothetical protein
MKNLLAATFALLLVPGIAAAQSSDRLPPANPLPYADADVDTAGALAAANRLLGSLATGGDAILAHVREDGGATAVTDKGVRRLTWKEFAANLKPDGRRFEERLTDPAVDVDGDIAMIWSPYVFLIDGKLSHCGVNHFDLVRENGQWKVLNITWTQRTAGCPAR